MDQLLDFSSIPLLAQVAVSAAPAVPARSAPFDSTASVLTLLCLIFGFACLIIWWATRYARMERELEHAGRMRAIDAGFLLPKDQPWWTPSRTAAFVAVGVPAVAFGIAFRASQVVDGAGLAWPSAAIVGATGVICGTIIYLRGQVAAPVNGGFPRSKPFVDPVQRELSEHLN